jgi:hypothetical protein
LNVGCDLRTRNRACLFHEAEYTRVIGKKQMGPSHLGLRAGVVAAFWALKVWMLLKGVGLDSLGGRLKAILPVPPRVDGPDQRYSRWLRRSSYQSSAFATCRCRSESPWATDDFNERLLIALQQTAARISQYHGGGRFTLRGCVLNYRTTLRDMDILLTICDA